MTTTMKLITVSEFAREKSIPRNTIQTRMRSAKNKHAINFGPVQSGNGQSPALWKRETLEKINNLFDNSSTRSRVTSSKSNLPTKAMRPTKRKELEIVPDQKQLVKNLLLRNKDTSNDAEFSLLLDALLEVV